MTLLSAPHQHIGQMVEGPSEYIQSPICANPFCGELWSERHHINRRSHVGRGKDAWWVEIYGTPWPNIVGLCRECHSQVTINRVHIEALPGQTQYIWKDLRGGHGRVVSDFLDPHPPLWADLTEGDQRAADDGDPEKGFLNTPPGLGSSPSVSSGYKGLQDINFGFEGSPTAGSKCPTCNRKVPHPKKSTSPDSVTWSVRMPADVKDEFKEIVEAAAAHLGCGEEKYSPYKTVLTALVAVLQSKPDGRAA